MTLEKIINKIKDAAILIKDISVLAVTSPKTLMAVGAMAGMVYGGVDEARAGSLKIYNLSSQISGSSMNISHIEGATESFDFGKDASWVNNPTNILQIYSKNPNCLPTTDQVSTDAKDPNSTTTFNNELYNNSFSGSVDNNLRIRLMDSSNFEWKNIFLGDANNSENPVADIKFKVYNSGKIMGGETPYEDFQLPNIQRTQPGVYDKRKVMFYNHADLNRDRKVNFQDFTILANEIGKNNISDPNRFGSYVGKNVNDLGAYADINRDGKVDNLDLMVLGNEWLWNANDSSTW